MDITVWIWMKLMPNLTLYFVHNVCKWEEFSCFHTAVEAIFSAVCDHFWTKTSFSTSSFWGSNYHFLDDLDFIIMQRRGKLLVYPIEIHFSRRGFLIFPNFDLKSRIWPVICLSQVWNLKFQRFLYIFSKIGQNSKKMKKNPLRQFYLIFEKINEHHFLIKPIFCYAVQAKLMVTMVTDEFLEKRIILQKSVATIGFTWFFWFQKCILLYIFCASLLSKEMHKKPHFLF